MTSNRLHVRHGTYGPQHDPYSFTEITMHCRAGKVTYHGGLSEWVKLDGKLVADCDDAGSVFEKLTGLDPYKANKLYDQLPYIKHRAKCKHGKFHRESGFPGETFTVCERCSDIVDTHFNRSAVE